MQLTFTVDIQKKVLSFTNKRIAATLKRQASSKNTDGSNNEEEEEEEEEIEDDSGIGTWIYEDREPEEEDQEEVKRVHTDLEMDEDYTSSQKTTGLLKLTARNSRNSSP